jgi:sirohydrochlorin cobaltochelatase
LLEPVAAEEAVREPEQYQRVVEEIGRGIWLVTSLPVLPRIAPGWVGVRCDDEAMAAWLVRAIVIENVIARHEETMLFLPPALISGSTRRSRTS